MIDSSSRPTLVVADASVLAQWVIPDEEPCPGSERLMADVASGAVALLEPPLLVHELTNALSTAVRRGRMSRDDASLAWQAFVDLDMLFGLPEKGAASALRLSFLPGVTAYDASYVVLAESQRCPFYTADRRLAIALSGRSPWVRDISEYGG